MRNETYTYIIHEQYSSLTVYILHYKLLFKLVFSHIDDECVAKMRIIAQKRVKNQGKITQTFARLYPFILLYFHLIFGRESWP